MNSDVILLIAEDDEGHFGLIRKNLTRAGIVNDIIHFTDGQEVIDYLFQKDVTFCREPGRSYVLLLDIRMPRVNGIEVLAQLKANPELRKLPVIIITTTDDPREVQRCHSMGCSSYIVKPVEYDNFVNAIRQLGLYLKEVKIPAVNGN